MCCQQYLAPQELICALTEPWGNPSALWLRQWNWFVAPGTWLMQNHPPQFHLCGHPSPHFLVFEWHISATWAIPLPASGLTRRVTHIKGATFSFIKRFAFELPTMDKKFELIVLMSKCQMLESQKNKSSSWVELCWSVAPFGSATFTLLLWEGRRLQSSICFPLWNQSNDPVCHFWGTAAAPARGSRGGRQKNIICYSRVLPQRRKSSSLWRQFYPKEAPEWVWLAVTAKLVPVCERRIWLQERLLRDTSLSVTSTAGYSLSAFRIHKQRDDWV